MPTRADNSPSGSEEQLAAPLGGTRSEAVQRLQIGLVGLAAMLLMVALANVVMERAMESDAGAVPDAVDQPQVKVNEPLKDPLVDAGVVPNLPAEKVGDLPDAPDETPGDAGQ